MFHDGIEFASSSRPSLAELCIQLLRSRIEISASQHSRDEKDADAPLRLRGKNAVCGANQWSVF